MKRKFLANFFIISAIYALLVGIFLFNQVPSAFAAEWHSIKNPLTAEIQITTDNTVKNPAYPSSPDLRAAHVQGYYLPSQGFVIRSDSFTGIVSNGDKQLIEGKENGYYNLIIKTSVSKSQLDSPTQTLYVIGKDKVSKRPEEVKDYSNDSHVKSKSGVKRDEDIKTNSKTAIKSKKENEPKTSEKENATRNKPEEKIIPSKEKKSDAKNINQKDKRVAKNEDTYDNQLVNKNSRTENESKINGLVEKNEYQKNKKGKNENSSNAKNEKDSKILSLVGIVCTLILIILLFIGIRKQLKNEKSMEHK